MTSRIRSLKSDNSFQIVGRALPLVGKALLTPNLEGHGHVLFTSRNRDLSRLGTLLEIPPMTAEEGIALLLRGYNDTEIQPRHKDTATNIIDRLGRLALAIDQAAAYIKYKRMPLDQLGDFLATYEMERRRILSYTPKKFWEYRDMQSQGRAKNISAFTTWEMSFRQLESGDEEWRKEDAAHFLTLSAFFAPTSITESLFRDYLERHSGKVEWIQIFKLDYEDSDEDDDEHNGEDENMSTESSSSNGIHGTWNSERYWDVIAKSDELSLLQSVSPRTDQRGASFSLHPLIRDWLQLRSNAKERQSYTQEAIEVLGCFLAAYHTRSTIVEERTALIPHMDISLSNDESFMEPQSRLGRSVASCSTARWFAKIYLGQGQYRTSEELYRRIIETHKSVLSESHPLMLDDMNALAVVLRCQTKYEEAESLVRQVVTLREGVLGDNHVETLASRHNLASVLSRRGRDEESEMLIRQTLSSSETILGKEHHDVLDAQHVLGSVLARQGRYEEAELIYRQVLFTSETVLGKDHRETLPIISNLALMLHRQGKYDEAERIHRSNLTTEEKVLGKEHPVTLKSALILANLLYDQGNYKEAERLCQQTLVSSEKVSGKDHPDTTSCIELLGRILRSQGKDEEAEQMSSADCGRRSIADQGEEVIFPRGIGR